MQQEEEEEPEVFRAEQEAKELAKQQQAKDQPQVALLIVCALQCLCAPACALRLLTLAFLPVVGRKNAQTAKYQALTPQASSTHCASKE